MAWGRKSWGRGPSGALPPPAPSNAAVLDVRDIRASYGHRIVLDGATVGVDAGTAVAIMGPSGSGKSTLLSVILGLLRPDSGTVAVDGQRVAAGMGATVARLRRETIGVVFQSGQLLPELSPLENVMLPALVAGVAPVGARERAAARLEELGLRDHGRPIGEYSGGEQQRIAIARALVNTPRLVVADEPTGSLDPGNRDMVIDALFSVPEEYGCALLVVTHDPVVARRADQVEALRGGALEPSDAETAWTGGSAVGGSVS